MKISLKKLFILLNLLVFSTLIFADEITFTAKAPANVEVGQRFYLEYSCNEKCSIELPKIDGIQISNKQPRVGSSSSFNYVNGRTTHTQIYTYSYIATAVKEGNFVIPPAKANIDASIYESNQIKITIHKKGSLQQRNNRSQNNYDPWGNKNRRQTQAQPPKEITSDDIYARIIVDKTKVYQGIPITATLKIYTKLDLAGFEDYSFPNYNGFWTEEIKIPEQTSLKQEIINGQTYGTIVIKKDKLIPQYSGEFTIEPAEISCIVRQIVNKGGGGLFGSFFSGYENRSVKIKSSSVKINVLPLPANAPKSFSGAVGKFNLNVTQSADTLETNEALSLKLEISGSGNLKLIEEPKINFPNEFEVFDPEVSTSANKKSFEYTIIPRYPGDYSLKNIEFSYFNPNTKRYETLKKQDINFFVKRDPNQADNTISNIYSKENIEYIGDQDILYIKTNIKTLTKGNKYFFGSFIFWLILALIIFGFIGFLVFTYQKIKQNSNIAKTRNKKASKVSMKRLKVAKSHIINNNKEAFYKEIMTALWGYLSDKLNIKQADLTKDNVVIKLQSKNINQTEIDSFLKILELCEYAAFAPTTEETQMQNIFQEAANIINNYEQVL